MALSTEQQRALAVARARRRKAGILATGERMGEIPGNRIGGAFEDAAPMADRTLPQSQEGTFLDPLVGQGILMGFGDEMKAGVRAGARTLFGDSGKPYGELYEEELGDTRSALEGFRERHPVASPALEIAGAVATTPFIPGGVVARGAGMGTRMAKGAITGATYGGVYGAGSAEGGLEDRALGAASGAAVGTLTGAAAPVVVRGVQAAGRGVGKLVSEITRPLRGLTNREREAARRIAVAMDQDASIQQPRLSLADEAAAIVRGQPVMNIDRGGETVRALGRSAANTSPQARGVLETAINDRYVAQGNRTIDTVRRIVGNVTAQDNRIALQQQAVKVNRPAYKAAYDDPAAQSMWDAGLEQLASAPVVQTAMKQAAITGRNAASLGGFAPFDSPFMVDKATGGLKLRGSMTPTLQFWDHVKRNLDGMGTGDARQAARVLREYLDELVPSYKTARAGAAQFFGAQDALEAGEMFIASRMENEAGRAGLAKMSAPEKKLFAEGFADALVRKISEASDRRNVINSIFISSPAARERVEIALGPQRARELEAFLRVEDLLDKARTAIQGNSTTARQLAELGVAGGVGASYGYTTGDWKSAGGIAIAGLLMRRGLLRIDRNVAQRIGEMLASPDPQIVQRGLKIITKNKRYMDALRAADLPAAAVGAETAADQVRQPLRIELNAGERDRMLAQ